MNLGLILCFSNCHNFPFTCLNFIPFGLKFCSLVLVILFASQKIGLFFSFNLSEIRVPPIVGFVPELLKV